MPNEHDDDRRAAAAAETPFGEFRVDDRRVVKSLVTSGLIGSASLAVIVAGLLVDFPEPVINKRVITVLVGAVGLVLSALLFAANWRKYGQQLVLSPAGIRLRKGGRWTEASWDDIAAVRRSSSTIGGSRALTETNLWIDAKDGRTIYLTSFFLEMERLAEVVLTETARRMVPEMWSRLQRGESVEFGTLKISVTELAAPGKEIAWDDVEAIQVASGGIDVRRRDGGRSWYYTPIKSLPNYHVFLELADRLLRADERES